MNCKGHSWMLVMIVACSMLIVATAFAKETKYQIFTPADVLYYDGSNGTAVYVVADGIVYDVSKGEYWKGGMREGMHGSGMDLTADLLGAPHGREVLRHMSLVGIFQRHKTWISQFLIKEGRHEMQSMWWSDGL
jgi:predicted heme/steroid binding protein